MSRSIVGAAWLTHFLEGVLCFIVARAHGLPGLPVLVDATMVGAGATTLLFKKLRIAPPALVGPLCIGSFAAIAYAGFQLYF